MVTLYCQSHVSILLTTVCGHCLLSITYLINMTTVYGHCLLPIIYLIIIHYCLWSLSIANHIPHYYSLLFVVTLYCQSHASLLFTTVCGHCLLPITCFIIIDYCLWSLSIVNHIPNYYDYCLWSLSIANHMSQYY